MPSLFAATEDLNQSQGFLKSRWPILAALLLVGTGAAVFVQQAGHRDSASAPSAPVADAAAFRPLGLYVDPSGASWRISWNPNATALRGARGVQLFVRDGDDQKRIELSAADLNSGTYRYQAKGPDVMFRLEVADSSGQVAAESFRLIKSVEKVTVTPPEAPTAPAKLTATHRVAPVVPASIRPRIKGTIPVDVRVKVDAQGRVSSATPAAKAHTGLEQFLTGRAVAAARQWRFEAGHEGTEIIHFTFQK